MVMTDLNTYPPKPVDRAAVLATARAGQLSDDFVIWLQDNLDIWNEFCALAALARSKGRTRWSARAILHILRWNRMVSDSGGVWKINNHWSAPMSRLYNASVGFDFFQERKPARSAAGYRIEGNTVPHRLVDGGVTVA